MRKELAGRKTIFQFGTQQRSYAAFQRAVNLVRNGYIGELQRIDAWCPEVRTRFKDTPANLFGSLEAAPVPAGVNFDLWTGPAALRPYTKGVLADWYHIYNYCLGFIANWGVHPLDIAQWGAGMDDSGPVYYEGIGTLPPKLGSFDTIENWDLHCRYANGVKLRFISRELAEPVVRRYHPVFRDHGTVFHGSEGWVGVDRAGVYSHGGNKLRKVQFRNTDRLVGYGQGGGTEEEKNFRRFQTDAGHQRNFMDCVRSRQTPISPFESAVRVDTIVQLADMCLRVKAPIEWDPQREALVKPTPAMKAMLDREMRAPYGI
jgi:predicted dehydrogenase